MHWPVTLTVAVGESVPSVAVIVAFAAPNATLAALKVACVDGVGTVTLAGTVTFVGLSLESVTDVSTPDAAANVTVMVAELKAMILLTAGVSVIPGLVTTMV
jgi:hypothetical protein